MHLPLDAFDDPPELPEPDLSALRDWQLWAVGICDTIVDQLRYPPTWTLFYAGWGAGVRLVSDPRVALLIHPYARPNVLAPSHELAITHWGQGSLRFPRLFSLDNFPAYVDSARQMMQIALDQLIAQQQGESSAP